MKINRTVAIIALLAVVAALALGAWVPTQKGPQGSLNGVWNSLKNREFVDLTHSFEPGTPHWRGFPARVFAILP